MIKGMAGKIGSTERNQRKEEIVSLDRKIQRDEKEEKRGWRLKCKKGGGKVVDGQVKETEL